MADVRSNRRAVQAGHTKAPMLPPAHRLDPHASGVSGILQACIGVGKCCRGTPIFRATLR